MNPIPVIEKEAKLKLKNCPSVPTKGEAKPPPDQEINLQIPKKGPVDSSGAKSDPKVSIAPLPIPLEIPKIKPTKSNF